MRGLGTLINVMDTNNLVFTLGGMGVTPLLVAIFAVK